jgi:hypothetical protein
MPCPHFPTFRSPFLSGAALLAVVLGGIGAAHAGDVIPADIKGQYELADGRLLTITGSGRRMRAQLDGRRDALLVPAGEATFDAVDGSFRLRFDEYENGSVTAVKLDEKRVDAPQAPARGRGAHAAGAAR